MFGRTPHPSPRAELVTVELQAVAQAIGLSKVYGSGQATVTALDDVSVDFTRGRLTAIMGPSGSGKSTLMHCMAALDTPTSGRIVIDGVDIGGLKDRALTQLRRDRLGFVFQAYNLIPTLTARENITLPVDIAGRHVDGACSTPSSTPWSSVIVCRTAPVNSPVGSSSGWPVPGRWSADRRSSSPTNPPATWTRGPVRRF